MSVFLDSLDWRLISLWLWVFVSAVFSIGAALRLWMAFDDEAARKRMGRNSNRKIISYLMIRKSAINTAACVVDLLVGLMLILPLPDWFDWFPSRGLLLAVAFLVMRSFSGGDVWADLRDRFKVRVGLLTQRPGEPPQHVETHTSATVV